MSADPDAGTCAYSLDVTEWQEAVSDWYDESYHGDTREGPVFESRFLDADDERWECLRRTRPADDYCVFHAHESDDGVACDVPREQVLLDIVNGETANRPWNRGDEPDGLWQVPADAAVERDRYKRREKQFVGAKLGEVTLSHERLDGPDSYPIDLRRARIERLDLSDARVEHRLNMSGLEQTADPDDADEYGIDVEGARFGAGFSLVGATVNGGITAKFTESLAIFLDHATVEGDVSTYRASMEDFQARGLTVEDGDVSIEDMDIDASVRLHESAVDGGVSLDRSEVGYLVYLDDAKIGGDVSLDDAIIEEVRLHGTAVAGEVSINRSAFGNNVTLSGARVDGSVTLSYARIDGYLKLPNAAVGGSLSVSNTDVRKGITTGTTSWEGAAPSDETRIDGSVTLSNVEAGDWIAVPPETAVGGRLAVEETTTPKLRIGGTLTHPAVNAVSLRESTITNALHLDAEAGNAFDGPVYDLARATVGDVDIDVPERDDDDATDRSFEHLRFLETRFDGFVFSSKHEQFRGVDWVVHEPRADGYRDLAVVTQDVHIREDDDASYPVFDIATDVVTSIVSAAVENRYGSRDRDLAQWYADAYFEVDHDDDRTGGERGDPVSRVAEWVRPGRSGADPSLDGSHDAVIDAMPAFEATLEDALDDRRIRRARVERPEPRATDQWERHRDRLSTAVEAPTTAYGFPLQRRTESELISVSRRSHPALESFDPSEMAERFPLPDSFDVTDDDIVTADHVAAAVARTLALNPALARKLAEEGSSAVRERERLEAGTDAPTPVRAICDEWAVPVDSPFGAALAGASEPIRSLARSVEVDHETLAAFDADLVVDDPPESVDSDGTHPYAAVADAILHPEAVEIAEATTEDDETLRSAVAELDEVGHAIETLETEVAHALVDPTRVEATDSEAESTYAAAKNGARAAGDETAAGQFFRREARYARRQHWQRWQRESGGLRGSLGAVAGVLSMLVGAVFLTAALTGLTSPLTAVSAIPSTTPVGVLVGLGWLGVGTLLGWAALDPLFDWFGNIFLGLTMGYGERPLRVLGFSTVVVVVFAVVYWVAEAIYGIGPPIETRLGYLIFSLELFVTLFFGDPRVDDPVIQLAAGLEGFFGVFVIGMFVVTVTRAIHR